MSGTSMATPFTAGVVALMLSKNPNLKLNPAQVKNILMTTAIDWGPAGPDNDFGAGRLDGYVAVDMADGSLTGITKPVVPKHFYATETITTRRGVDTWNISVNSASYPIAIGVVMPNWISSVPDFDIYLYDPKGKKVASYTGNLRQDTINYTPAATGTFKLKVQSASGTGAYFIDLSAGATALTLSSDDDPSGNSLVAKLAPDSSEDSNVLEQAYPNPANPDVWIPFTLSKADHVIIKIYNTSGSLIKTLDLGDKMQGAYLSKDKAAYWDGRNEAGEKVVSGVYFYTIQTGKFIDTGKLIIQK